MSQGLTTLILPMVENLSLVSIFLCFLKSSVFIPPPHLISHMFLPLFALIGSPFSVPVHDTVDPTKVKCQGQGLGTNVRANIPQVFTVDASKAGVAPLQVRVQGPKGEGGLHVANIINGST